MSRESLNKNLKAVAQGLWILVAFIAFSHCKSAKVPWKAQELPVAKDTPALIEKGPLSDRIANYSIVASYDPAEKTVNGESTLVWKNTSDTIVDKVPVHLYLNAFKSKETLFYKETKGQFRSDALKDGGWGSISVAHFKQGEDTLEWDVEEYNGKAEDTLVWVRLKTPIKPGESLTLKSTFTSKLPKVYARTGHAKDFALVGQWFPKIGVLEKKGKAWTWQASVFHGFSEFYSDFGVYDVTINVPHTHVVGATGVLVSSKKVDETMRELKFLAEDVHDFAFVVDPYLKKISGVATVAGNTIDVDVLYYPKRKNFAERHLKVAIDTLEKMSELYRAYPWSSLTVVDPPKFASGASGMEYPTFITTSGDGFWTANKNVRLPEYVTIHEIGHQWFQGMLASNETQDAWLDEGINSYSNAVVGSEIHEGPDFLDRFGWELYGSDIGGVILGEDWLDPIDQPPHRFVSFSGYGAMTYQHASLAFLTLERTMGIHSFRQAMKKYTEEFAFKHPTRQDLLGVLEREMGENLDWFFEPVLDKRGAASLSVKRVKCGKEEKKVETVTKDAPGEVTDASSSESPLYDCNVLVANTGRLALPVDIEVTFVDGRKETHVWQDRGEGPRWKKVAFTSTSPIELVELDPDRKILLDKGGVERSWKLVPNLDSSSVMISRVSFLTQSLMQWFGF